MYAQAYQSTSSSSLPSPYGSAPAGQYRASPVSRNPYTSPPPQHIPNGPSMYARGPQLPQASQQRVLPRQPGQPGPPRHKGTLAPGQLVKVGDHIVRIERYLSEGGYAHVYLTTSDTPISPPHGGPGYTQHCLKRIAFQDESVWADVKKEIEVMKALPPNRHLTQYLGSAHSKIAQGYEVYILMEFCSGGGIIDLLNKRLRDRLKEIEILNIFTDVCEAVAAMHALRQPLLHRDLKIENVLSSPSGQPATPQRPTPLIFKLCDFGSTTFPATKPPSTKLQSDTLALDLNKHTTLQYRSPEMVEPMLGLPIGLPSDVWALGVLLYKLCYYTTPFEEHGTLAIVNAKYTFPQYPVYSPRLQHLIASMLLEHPSRRPSVFHILKEAHDMSGTRPEVEYATPSPPPLQIAKADTSNLLDMTNSPDRQQVMQPLLPTVQPQRRGRPGKTNPNGSDTKPPATTFSPPVQNQQLSPMQTRHISRAQQPNSLIQPSPSMKPILSPQNRMIPSPVSMSPPSATLPTPRSSGPPSRSSTLDAFGVSSSHPARQASGFSDSFGVPPKSSKSSYHSFSIPEPDRAPSAEHSFETRFPSIESLSSNSTPTPRLISPIASTSPALISPVKSPPLPSFMSNMTGGDITKTQTYKPDGYAARSTNVTGTAFKLTPSTVSPSELRKEYFENNPTPVDLLTGDLSATDAGEDKPSRPTPASSDDEKPESATRMRPPSAMERNSPLPEKPSSRSSQRPKSMYVPSVSTPRLSPLPNEAPRPQHVRKGSINDIVSRYENMAVKQAPAVAAKPAGLRRSSTQKQKPDILKPVAVRYGQTPEALSVPQKSPTKQTLKLSPKLPSSGPVSPLPTREESPEKKQSVNSLIARWNQGNVGSK